MNVNPVTWIVILSLSAVLLVVVLALIMVGIGFILKYFGLDKETRHLARLCRKANSGANLTDEESEDISHQLAQGRLTSDQGKYCLQK